mmetsp:Transcript_46331/g.110293  ORF Transcript_46331/g.110293 Transcript_46331/m.110293 type:complete len:218 (+) Transcript_46331:1512-2165(+)
MITARSSRLSVASHISNSRVLDTPHLSFETTSFSFFWSSVSLLFVTRSFKPPKKPPAESAIPRSMPPLLLAFAAKAAAVAALTSSSSSSAAGAVLESAPCLNSVLEDGLGSPGCASSPSSLSSSSALGWPPLLMPPNFALCVLAALRSALSCAGSLIKLTSAFALSRMGAPTSWPPWEYSNMKRARNFIWLPKISLVRSLGPCFSSASTSAKPFWIL